ncbi:MAG: hypothetical protein MGG37_21280 [Trichodesmium sp. MAG_R01]|nr:hypothetical protein [Trichodesmium sp. MAG_R01]
MLGFAGLSLPTGGGAFSKKLGSYERSLLGKNLPPNISVGLCWVGRAQAYLWEGELSVKSWEVMSDRYLGKIYPQIYLLGCVGLGGLKLTYGRGSFQ